MTKTIAKIAMINNAKKNRDKRNKSKNSSFERQQYNIVYYKCDEEKHK